MIAVDAISACRHIGTEAIFLNDDLQTDCGVDSLDYVDIGLRVTEALGLPRKSLPDSEVSAWTLVYDVVSSSCRLAGQEY